jgi:hypothetical protein
MNELLLRLDYLGYESFLKKTKLQPIKQPIDFNYFSSLAAWLLHRTGKSSMVVEEYSDPTIVLETLRRCNVDISSKPTNADMINILLDLSKSPIMEYQCDTAEDLLVEEVEEYHSDSDIEHEEEWNVPVIRVAVEGKRKRDELQQLDQLSMLDKFTDDLESQLDKIKQREKSLEMQFNTDKIKVDLEKISQLRRVYEQLSENNQAKNDELARINMDLEAIQDKIDLGMGVNDPRPLVQLREARESLKRNSKENAIRISLMRHQVLM